jgi:hypothetical protein
MTTRRFHSYGPVDCRYHFCVPRTALVEKCANQLVGTDGEAGHYFTIWAARQTGKTWLMGQAKAEIEKNQPDQFIIGAMSCQGIILEESDPEAQFLENIPRLFQDTFGITVEAPASWAEWIGWFSNEGGIFEKPVILFIDEFDSLPPHVIDRIVTLFRDMYLKRDAYRLHGLALIGVRAVLGVDSLRGSPFNVQRSLRVPNLTANEVNELFDQYQRESGQTFDQPVVDQVFRATRGQPGLVSWFGELLTETYNPGPARTIGMADWDIVYNAARNKEWNNTLLNLIQKARGPYAGHVLALFSNPEMPFTIRAEWCAFLYLNGIIDEKTVVGESGKPVSVCRFSSPFVQNCLFDAFTDDLIGERLPILALEPMDRLADVFEGDTLHLPALLGRYKGYLQRLKAGGADPWKAQPRRADLRLTEAAGHFHLYHWLKQAVGDICVISPEFPTGNGRVDLHLDCRDKRGIIEVKSFESQSRLDKAKRQAADYARKLGQSEVTVALFTPVTDEDILAGLSTEETIDGVRVTVVAIGWT